MKSSRNINHVSVELLSNVSVSPSSGVYSTSVISAPVVLIQRAQVTRRQSVEWSEWEWEPADSLPSGGGVTSSSQTAPVVEEEVPFQNT
jgi:hypothetical protein